MRKILITGAAGFIGSHLTELCVARGLKVKAFIHYNSTNCWGWLEEIPVKNRIEVVAGDVRDYDSVYAAMKGCDSVLHLAALIGIPYSYISPLAYIRTNMEGTYNVLQAARELHLKTVVITSTSETYGTAKYVPINEKHPLVGQSPYSATKIAADQLAISFYRSFGLPVKIARPFNTYGPRQSARAIIPTIISQLLYGKNELRLGNLHPTRDLTFVKDTANGILAVAQQKGLHGEVINIGSGSEEAVGELALRIAGLLKKKIRIVKESQRLRPAQSEVERLVCDNTRLKGLTGWQPLVDLNSGLRATIDFIKEYSHLYKPGIYHV